MSTNLVRKVISGMAVISCLPLIQHISTVRAHDEYEIVIATGKALKCTMSGATLALQNERAGTVLSLETKGVTIAGSQSSTFTARSLEIGTGMCFMQLQFHGGSAQEWSVETVTVTSLKNTEKVTFAVNNTVKFNEPLTVDNCKQRQQS